MSEETRHLSQSEDPVFIDLLARALEVTEDGGSVDLRELCADRPDLIPELEAALTGAGELSLLHESAAGFDPALNQTIGGRYTLRDRLGSGGMGVVYRAEDRELRRNVAVKMLRPDVLTGEELEQRLAREAEVLASVTHPAIIPVFDRGRSDNGQSYVVMPVLDGLSGSELIESAPNPDPSHPAVNGMSWVKTELGEGGFETNFVRQSASWVAQIARGLAVIHEAGVVHRDVKPSNIFVQKDGQPLLLDFGLVTYGADTTLAQRDTALGTPAYMAPEQLDPRIEPTPAIDIYGLCATLYHFLTFERPFRGSASQVLAALQRREPRPAGSIRPGLPRDLLAILDRGMAKEPKNRYPSARALAEDLEAWLDFRPVSARPVSGIRRVFRRARRSPVAKTLLAVCVLAGAGLATKAGFDSRERERQEIRKQNGRESGEIWNTIPTTVFATQPASLRRNSDPDLAKRLRRLAELEEVPGLASVVLALHFQQQEQPADAAQVLARVAAAQNSDLCDQVSERIAATEPGQPSDLEGLGEPQTDIERFVYSSQIIWRTNLASIRIARSVLQDCTPGLLGAAELLAWMDAMLLVKGAKTSDSREDLRLLRDRLLKTESSRGFHTASLSSTLGYVSMSLGLLDDAIEELARATELAPSDYTHWINYGRSLQREVLLKEAEDAFHQALRIAPGSLQARINLVRNALEEQDFDLARDRIKDIPATSARGRRARLKWQGSTLLAQACVVLFHERGETPSKKLIDEAHERLDEAYDYLQRSRPRGAKPTWEMLLCLCVKDRERYFPELVERALEDSLNHNKLREISLLVPKTMDERCAAAASDLIRAMSQALAPNRLSTAGEATSPEPK